jgi:putative membrane protein
MNCKNTPALIAAALGMIISGAAWAQDATTGGQSSDRQKATVETRNDSSSGSSTSGGQQSDSSSQGQGQGRGQGQGQGQGRGQGRGSDMQINQQLMSFAQDPNTAADKCFVVMAAIDNEFEIQSGQAALQKSQNDQVKQVAQKMVDDHTKAKAALQTVAQALNVQLPDQLPRMKQAELAIMNALPADQFDKNYMAHLQAAHAKDVTKFNSVSQLAQNDQVKQFAQQQLPVLQAHASHVNQTAQALGLPSGMEPVTAGAKIQGSSDSKSADPSK